MNTKETCSDCGIGIGMPHQNECDIERCSACGCQRISCGCATHDPSKSIWTGEWPEQFNEEELALREIEELNGASQNVITPPTEESEFSRYQDYVPDQMDMEQLAHSYLQEAISLFRYTFFTGWCEDDKACLFKERFERVAEHLGEEKRREIIDDLDTRRKATDGDNWEVFKYTCTSDFWSAAANFDAVLRVADKIPENLPPEQEEKYGLEVLETLRTIREKRHTIDWDKEGF